MKKLLIVLLLSLWIGASPAFAQEECKGSGFVFLLSPADCKLVEFNQGEVAVLRFDLSKLVIEAPRLISVGHSILYLGHVENAVPRSQAGLKNLQPEKEQSGIKTYRIRNELMLAFTGADGRPVYVSRQSYTSEVARIIGNHIDVLYRIDNGETDLIDVDRKISEFLNKIIVE